MFFQEQNYDVFSNIEKQKNFLKKLQDFIVHQNYGAVVILCGNFLLGVNSSGDILPCIPEIYETTANQEALNLCRYMDIEHFDTRFSYFSFDMGISLFSYLRSRAKSGGDPIIIYYRG